MGYRIADDHGYGDETFHQRTRNVYGVDVLFSRQKYRGNFLFELYMGISIRYINEHLIKYSEVGIIPNTPNMGVIQYDPPKHITNHLILPAIQGGFNIGLGFKKKKM